MGIGVADCFPPLRHMAEAVSTDNNALQEGFVRDLQLQLETLVELTLDRSGERMKADMLKLSTMEMNTSPLMPLLFGGNNKHAANMIALGSWLDQIQEVLTEDS
ncbi:hypothetical protein KIPB_008014 [Kipferlia bialata]|uniref:Uncharacterized protein n=1 Tax=Kipferlia bialata TaxID=797122 RepID=A0A9K3CZV5_9EUKA|nr:hypothetical protein KIPB_008014 [Kipferlia bialata]|eukprot:g8014.t1